MMGFGAALVSFKYENFLGKVNKPKQNIYEKAKKF